MNGWKGVTRQETCLVLLRLMSVGIPQRISKNPVC